MRLTGAAFNRMLNQMGQSFSWRKSFACPCISKNSGQAKPNCPHCSGKGRLWGPPVEGDAGIVSRSKMRDFATFGIWDQDDIMLTIPSDSPLYDMGQFDRVAALNRSEPFSLNLVRGLNDQIKFPILSVDRVFWLNVEDSSIHEGSLPTVNDNGTLSWGAGAPPAGVTFSLTGRRAPEYFCYQELPTDRPMHFGEKLPRRVALRRFDLFGR
jgi:hypothetical protein